MSRAMIVLSNDAQRAKAIGLARKAPVGTRVEFKAAQRSLSQNSHMWALLTDVAQQATHRGQKYTADQWKVIFLHALGREIQFLPALEGSEFVPYGQSSSDLSKHEMSDLIDLIMAWGAQNNIDFNPGASPAPDAGGERSTSHLRTPAAGGVARSPSASYPEIRQ